MTTILMSDDLYDRIDMTKIKEGTTSPVSDVRCILLVENSDDIETEFLFLKKDNIAIELKVLCVLDDLQHILDSNICGFKIMNMENSMLTIEKNSCNLYSTSMAQLSSGIYEISLSFSICT